jgi:hypothetical protein
MIEHLFDLVKGPTRKSGPRMARKSRGQTRNRIGRLGVYTGMKRDSSSLVLATLRTGFLVGFALLLILVLFPAAIAQASGPR